MKTPLLALTLLASACSSEVDLELELDSWRPCSASESGPPGPSWSSTDFGPGYSAITHVDWSAGGDLLVAGGMSEALVDSSGTNPPGEVTVGREASFLKLYATDGTARWTLESPEWSVLAMDSMPCGTGFVAAMNVNPTPAEPGDDDDEWTEPTWVTAIWFLDAEGSLLASRTLDATETTEAVRHVTTIVALPDGGVVWGGYTDRGGVVGRLDATGEHLWTLPVGTFDTTPEGTRSVPPEDVVEKVALLPDGGIIVFGQHRGAVAIDDESISAPFGAFVAHLQGSGSVTWLAGFPERYVLGLEVGPTGRLVMSEGGFDDETFRHYLVELDEDGREVARTEGQPPQAGVGASQAPHICALRLMALSGEHAVLGGTVIEHDPAAAGRVESAYVGIHDRTGALVGEQRTSVLPSVPSSSGMTHDADVAPDGRLAAVGSFQGVADFGHGPVTSPPSLSPEYPYNSQGFISIVPSPLRDDD